MKRTDALALALILTLMVAIPACLAVSATHTQAQGTPVATFAALPGSGVTSAARILAPAATDSDILATLSFDNSGAALGVFARAQSDRTATLCEATGGIVVLESRDSMHYALATLDTPITDGTAYLMRLRLVGDDVRCHVWPVGAPEPTAWLELTDTVVSGGSGALVQTHPGAGPATLTVLDFAVSAP